MYFCCIPETLVLQHHEPLATTMLSIILRLVSSIISLFFAIVLTVRREQWPRSPQQVSDEGDRQSVH